MTIPVSMSGTRATISAAGSVTAVGPYPMSRDNGDDGEFDYLVLVEARRC
jgi:hypothetical protein